MNNKIITAEHKRLYKTMINEILSDHGLTNDCILHYQNSSIDYCDNCLFDPVTKVSSNIYNGTGPRSFIDNTICPECMGAGTKKHNTKTKHITLAIIFDSKYFLNMDSKVVNISDVAMQSICAAKYANDLLNCSALSINGLPNVFYERTSDINLVGLGDLDYIFINWKKQ